MIENGVGAGDGASGLSVRSADHQIIKSTNFLQLAALFPHLRFKTQRLAEDY
jgi:hypothetical protein